MPDSRRSICSPSAEENCTIPRRMWNFFKTYKHKCPDGSTKIVFRSVDDAFPLYLGTSEVKLKGKGSAQGAGALEGDLAVKQKVEGLLFELDELNSSLMLQFRAAYAVYQSDPCKYSDYLASQVSALTAEQTLLNRVRIGTRALVALAATHPGQHVIDEAYSSLIGQLPGKLGAQEAARREIDETRKAADRWIEGNDGG